MIKPTEKHTRKVREIISTDKKNASTKNDLCRDKKKEGKENEEKRKKVSKKNVMNDG
jgi:hypothetical protein